MVAALGGLLDEGFYATEDRLMFGFLRLASFCC